MDEPWRRQGRIIEEWTAYLEGREKKRFYCVRELGEEGETRGTHAVTTVAKQQMHEVCEAQVDRGLLAGEEISKQAVTGHIKNAT